MREIKFRAWGHYPYKLDGKNEMRYNWQDSEYIEYVGFDGSNHFEIMQYTGLKDIDGKDIYEGDILKMFGEDRYCEVRYDELSASFRLRNNEGWQLYNPLFMGEVIGNIYENPELLEANKDE